MDQTAASSSGKVKVEYHDPHNVFPCISADLEAKLPLRNLNWNSPTRPLRLIDTLVIELEHAEGERTLPSSDSNAGTDDGTTGQRARSQSLRNRDSDGAGNRKERRHQIPGLRRTPYLKVLFIRCDDTDTYKSTIRKEIREWIKAHTPPSQKSSKGSNQENHDAFEWMVIHVAMPDVDRRVSWPHRNSQKILSYLQDDFNSSSKNAVNHVAQVPSTRFSATDEGKVSIPDQTFGKQASEVWDSALGTFKQLILSSFDQRVRQYEDDVKEKRAQRSLPGWNFCTFFVLKEGLSRGFESVGLVEDALSGYDELHAELDGTIRSKHDSDAASTDATTFRDSTPEIVDVMRNGLPNGQTHLLSVFERQVLDADKKPYRDLILSSDISVFDFKSYIFAKEINLLQRLGSYDRSSATGKTLIEPRILCDICQRTTAFIASAGAILRNDAAVALANSKALREESADSRQDLVLRTVSAWMFAVSSQVLDLVDKKLGPTQQTRPSTGQKTSGGVGGPGQGTVAANTHYRSLLSSRRAALTLITRRSLQHIGSGLGWRTGWEAAKEHLRAVELGKDADSALAPDIGSKDMAADSGPGKSLKKALSSQVAFQSTFVSLTHAALQRHQDAGDPRSARSMQIDLAAAKFTCKEYAESAELLEKILQLRLDHTWSGSQSALLSMLSQCYKALGREEEHVKTTLRLIAFFANANASSLQSSEQDLPYITVLMQRALEASKGLQEDVLVRLDDFVKSIKFDTCIHHDDEAGGFSLKLWLTSLVLACSVVDKFTLSLEAVESDSLVAIQMSTQQGVEIPGEAQEVNLFSDTTFPGDFKLKSLTLRMGKVVFSHQFDYTASVQPPRTPFRMVRHLPILKVWFPSSSPNIRLEIFEKVDLDRPKSILLIIESGQETLQSAQVHLRSGSAGLRLHTSQAKLVQGQCTISDVSRPGAIAFGAIQATSSIRLAVPFQMDFDLKSISLRCELVFVTSHGPRKIGQARTMPVVLPLGVNVQDVFKARMLFSKFSISSSTGIPLRVLDYDLKGIPGYKVDCPAKSAGGFPVFGQQPACLTYKIQQDRHTEASGDTAAKLRLAIKYQCLDEEILQTTRQALTTELEKSSLTGYRHLLESYLETIVHSRLSHTDLEAVALLREFTVPPYEDLQWDVLLTAVPSQEQQKLSAWLRAWHHQYTTVSLQSMNDRVPTRMIDIPVEVPPMQVVHTVRLDVISPDALGVWHVGDAIPATLQIRLSTRWSRGSHPGGHTPTFNYELDAPPDAWIIGGQRRGLFSLIDEQELMFPVLLLPQRAGHLMLPSLDVRPVNNEASNSPIHSEIDYQSQGESVLVIPAMQTPTVGVNIRGERRSYLIDAA